MDASRRAWSRRRCGSRRCAARFGGAPPESIAYLNHPVGFDTRRALAILEPHGLRPPSFTDYVDAMVGFFREHEDDPALARV